MTTEPKSVRTIEAARPNERDSATPAAEHNADHEPLTLPTLPPVYGWSVQTEHTLRTYGERCAEHVAGPLRTALSECATAVGAGASPDCSIEFLRDVPREVELFVSKLRQRIAELERDLQFVERWANHHGVKPCVTPAEALSMIQHYPAITAITGSYSDGKRPETPNPYAELDRLRAESVIEWEPGRSYTAAELLRRVIANIRPRKGDMLWPAVIKACGVGSTVAHFLCRWAGRDPDTGADLEAARAAGKGK